VLTRLARPIDGDRRATRQPECRDRPPNLRFVSAEENATTRRGRRELLWVTEARHASQTEQQPIDRCLREANLATPLSADVGPASEDSAAHESSIGTEQVPAGMTLGCVTRGQGAQELDARRPSVEVVEHVCKEPLIGGIDLHRGAQHQGLDLDLREAEVLLEHQDGKARFTGPLTECSLQRQLGRGHDRERGVSPAVELLGLGEEHAQLVGAERRRGRVWEEGRSRETVGRGAEKSEHRLEPKAKVRDGDG